MILATITWKHISEDSEEKKSEDAELTLSKCAGLVSMPFPLGRVEKSKIARNLCAYHFSNGF